MNTCTFVGISELLEPLSAELSTEFFEDGLPFTFGDCNRNMVSPARIVDYVENIRDDANNPTVMVDAQRLIASIYQLECDYIDIAN